MFRLKHNIWRLIFISLSIFICQTASAQNKGHYYLSGVVRDSVSLEPLPFASVVTGDTGNSALTNEKGVFEMTVPNNTEELIITCLGYNRKTMRIRKNKINLYDVLMSPAATELNEVVVHRQKYSKKNNPAVDLVRAIKEKAPLTDPKRNEYYSYDRHMITTLGLNDFVSKNESSALFKKFPFLWENVDTSEISGKPVLNLIVKEKSSEFYYRKDPLAFKEIVTGNRQEGLDDFLDKNSMETFVDDVLAEIDLYRKDIKILQNNFVSPLSPIAPDFYKFYLTDTVMVDNEKCIQLSFYPHNQAAFGFKGHVYVPVNDTTMFIKKVVMRIPKDINLNWIENLYIAQDFEKAPDGSRLKMHDDLVIEARLMKGTAPLFARRNIAYGNHSFQPAEDTSVYENQASTIVQKGAEQRDEAFWNEKRMIGVTENEKKVGNLMDKLRSVPIFYWSEKVLKILFTGYINTGKDSKFDIGPMNTTVSFNDVEGLRLRAGGITTANLNKHFFTRFYVARGFKDHKWKYGAELEYSFNEKVYHSREFPVHSFKLTSLYDIDQIGQHYIFTNMDNVFLSLKRLSNYNVTYHLVNQLEYKLELQNNFSVSAAVKNEKQFATQWLPFVDGYGNSFPSYTENTLTVELRYAPGEKYYQTKTYRIPIKPEAPVLTLSHTIAPEGLLGSKFPVNKTEMSVAKRFWFSAFGYTDIYVKGGHVWSRSPYINLLIPNANLSYTIQNESFDLMNPMEFINDSYVSWDVTYWLNGALFNLIPGWKKLQLREAVTFRGLWGNLSDRNDPVLNPGLFRFPSSANVTKMTDTPYMELSAGIDNIFKVLRVDYVWRLSYLDVPYKIDRHGIRVAVHVTF